MERVQSLEIIQETINRLQCKAQEIKIKQKTIRYTLILDTTAVPITHVTVSCTTVGYIEQLDPYGNTTEGVRFASLQTPTVPKFSVIFLSLQSGKLWDSTSNYQTVVALHILSNSVLPVHIIYSGSMTLPFDKSQRNKYINGFIRWPRINAFTICNVIYCSVPNTVVVNKFIATNLS